MDEDRVYTISIGWKIFMISVAIFMIGFAMFLFSMGTGVSNNDLIYLMPITIIVGSIWIIAQQIRRKIIISDLSIVRINAFATKEIAIKDIKGCRVGDKIIVIVPLSDNETNIVINNYDVLRNSDELANYFRKNFKDQDKADIEIQHAKELQNSDLGATEEDRNQSLKKIKQISWTYNIIGFILGFAMIAFNGKVATLILLIYPLLGILLMLLSKGMIKFLSNSKRSVYGFIMLGFFLPCFILMLKGLSGYTTLELDHFWLPFLMVSGVLFLSLYFIGINRSVASLIGQSIIMLIASLIYGLGSTRMINCQFDSSEPKLIHSTINSKWIEHNKGTFYHLKINSWNANPEPKDLEVSRYTYDQMESGSNIDVNVKPGLLHIPWFYINE